MFLLPANDRKEYRLEGRLIGHKNAINCLSISIKGTLLASGGSDGMRIWDLKKRLQLPMPCHIVGLQNPANPVTCTCWITHQEVTHETLCYGTGLGFIGIWQQHGQGLEDFDTKISRRIGTGKEIMCLTYDHAGNDTRIATGTCDKHVQVWTFDFKGPLVPIFSIELSTTIPHMIHFNHTASRNILVFGMYNRDIHSLQGMDGVIIATHNAGPLMHISVDITQTVFLIDNVMNGFSLHRLDDGACIRTYNTNPVKTFPKQVAFGENMDIVVGGSNTGVIYVFDKNTTDIMSKRAASNDDAPIPKHFRIDDGTQTAPLADECAWGILEQFLTTDMTDGNDNLALKNLCAVKAKHIHLASYTSNNSSMADRQLSTACIQSSHRPAKLKNPYLDLAAEEADEYEDEEDVENDNDDDDGPSSWKVTFLASIILGRQVCCGHK
ncbi:WD40-repeat-containing domain protein [Suillus cothurnatus]|nr:WD40-repeat-containing domain protein [Suillus cothurnatus]